MIQTSASTATGSFGIALGQCEELRVEFFLGNVMPLVRGFSFRLRLRVFAELVICRHGQVVAFHQRPVLFRGRRQIGLGSFAGRRLRLGECFTVLGDRLQTDARPCSDADAGYDDGSRDNCDRLQLGPEHGRDHSFCESRRRSRDDPGCCLAGREPDRSPGRCVDSNLWNRSRG